MVWIAIGTQPVGTSSFYLFESALSKAPTMNTPDKDIVLTAIEDARRILGEYIAPGPSDATRTVHRLIAVLDRDEVVQALDRMKRRRTLRLVE